jgi:4-amino-4-deoxy-L-arabinose transferase-like glycosyltransferase
LIRPPSSRPRARPPGNGIADATIAATAQTVRARSSLAASAVAWVLVLGVAIAARLALILLTAGYQAPWPWEVEVMSRALVETGMLGFNWFGRTPIEPSAFLPPVYPLFVAGAMWLGGAQYVLALRLAQLVVSTIGVAVLVLVAREVAGSRGLGFLAGLIGALYPTFVIATVQVNTVALEVLFVELFALGLLRWWRDRSLAWLVGSGLALGLLTLTRGPAALLWLVVAAWLLFVRPSAAVPLRLLQLAAFTLAMIVPMVPWAARNYVVFHQPVLIATNAGYNFWVGHNASANGEFDSTWGANQPLIDQSAALSEPERDRFYMQRALAYVRDHPADEVALSARKLWYFLWFRPALGSSYQNDQRLRDAGELALMAGYGAIVPFAIAGMWLTRRDWRRLAVVYGVWPVYAASAVAFFSATRYRSPAEPFLVVFATIALASLAGQMLRQRRA